MSKKQLTRYRSLACIGLVAGLSACTSLIQNGAPIESGNASRFPAPAVSTPAPVDNGATGGGATTTPLTRPLLIRPDGARANTHVVAPGETLYRIAVNNGLKYQDLASWNQLPEDFGIKVGQTLRLTPPDGGVANNPASTKPAASPAPKPTQTASANSGNVKTYPKALKLPYSEAAIRSLPSQSEGHGGTPATRIVSAPPVATRSETPVRQSSAKTESSAAATDKTPAKNEDSAAAASTDWIWPTQGKMIRGFSDSNKGIDIGGKTGQAVIAVGSGKVVYSGSGLRGYGKLIIIKHDKTYLTAYAHNSQLLVKEGQDVKKGQKIAEMGNSDADQVKLHFEVRRFGKPVDPTQYLDKQS